MRRMKTKVSALLVALCMLASLLPAIPVVTAEAAGGTITLDFTQANNTTVKDATGSTGWTLDTDETADAMYNALDDGSGNANHCFYAGGLKLKMNTGKIGFKFNVTTAGYYDLGGIIEGVVDNTRTTKVFVKTAGADSAAVLGVIDGTGLTTTYNEDIDLSGLRQIYLNAGENTLIFENTATYTNIIFLREVTFTPAETAEITLNFTASEIVAADKASATTAVDGWALNTTNTTSDVYYPDVKALRTYRSYASGFKVAFDFEVKKAGYYKIGGEVESYPGYLGEVEVSILNKYSLGNIDSTTVVNGYADDIDLSGLRSVYLNEGVNTVVFKGVSDKGSGLILLFRELIFTEAGELSLGFTSTNGGLGEAAVRTAATAPSGWTLNTDETTIVAKDTDGSLNAAEWEKHEDVYGVYAAFKVFEDKTLSFDFNAPADGDYELILKVFEYPNAGGNVEVLVNDTSYGEMYNDNNDTSDKVSICHSKGFGKVSLTKGKNTLTFKGLKPDVVGDYTSGGVGGVMLYLYSAEFTKTDANVVSGIKIDSAATSLNVGETTTATATVSYSGGGSTSQDVEILTTDILKFDGDKIKAIAAGTGLISAKYTENGIEYEDQVRITVKEPNSAIFGKSYAYVEENNEGTYSVTFIGGLDGKDYVSAGFEIWIDGRMQDYATTELVYKKLNVNGTEYDPSAYGCDKDAGYIFVADTDYAFEARTYTIKPYVIAEGDVKIYHEDLNLVIAE